MEDHLKRCIGGEVNIIELDTKLFALVTEAKQILMEISLNFIEKFVVVRIAGLKGIEGNF